MNQQDFETILSTTPWWEMLEKTGRENLDNPEIVHAIHTEMMNIVTLENCWEAPCAGES